MRFKIKINITKNNISYNDFPIIQKQKESNPDLYLQILYLCTNNNNKY